MFTTIDPEKKLQVLAHNIVLREREVFGYQINIDNYETALLTLPQEDWPERLAQFKDMNPDALPLKVPAEDMALVSDLLYRDRLRYLLTTERIEQNKSKRIYAAMVAQLPPERAQQLIQDAAATLPPM